ncbi:MAG: hydroxyacylglutathione hydrolase [Myxococcota bacterium]
MAHAVEHVSPPIRLSRGALEVHMVPAWQDNLIWLVVDREGRAAAVDGPVADGVLTYCDENDFTLTEIWNTHTHHDHIGINLDLDKRGLLDDLTVRASASAPVAVPGLDHAYGDGDTFSFGGESVSVMLTEGHIDGHITFVVDDAAFTGDTMFVGGCGYLFDGPPRKMHDSLTRLAGLPDATRVFCAHEYTQDNLRFAWSLEPENEDLAQRIQAVWRVREEGRCTVPTTIGDEKRTNPFLRHRSLAIRAKVKEHFPDVALDDPATVFAATRKLKDKKLYKALKEVDLPLG